MTPNQPTFTPAELEKMRHVLMQHDKTTGSPNEFDLNRPPRVPYSHQEYPRVLYGQNADGIATHKKVNDDDELALALENGWSMSPVVEDVLRPLDASTLAEIAAIDQKLAEAKTKAPNSRARRAAGK